MDAIIFDVDGTLWDPVKAITDSWNYTIEHNSPYSYHIEYEDLKNMLGKPLPDFYEKFFPDLPEEERFRFGEQCTYEENEYIKEHPGIYFPGVLETLREMAKKIPLYIVSNCQSGYIEALIEVSDIADIISGHSCHGDTLLPKSGTIRKLMADHGLEDVVYVGDTRGDYEACLAAEVPFILADYGFGDVPEAERKISAFTELPAMLGLE